MTDPRAYLADVLAKADAATPGPWKWDGDLADGSVTLEAAVPEVIRGHEYPTTTVISASGMHTEGYIYLSPENATFIASSRTTSPALARALLAVLSECDLFESRQRESMATMTTHHLRTIITTELAKEIEHG